MAKKADKEGLPLVTTFQIADDLAKIKAKIESQDGELMDGDFELLNQWQCALEVKCDNICHVDLHLQKLEDYYKAVEERAKALRKRSEDGRNRLRRYMKSCMEAADVKNVKKKDGLFSITVCSGRPSVEIVDQFKLPNELVEHIEVIKPKTDAIKKALEEGKKVPGAQLLIGESYLQIR